MESITKGAALPSPFYGPREPVKATVWNGGDPDGAWSVVLDANVTVEVRAWTTREGVERLRDACNAALAEADCRPAEQGVVIELADAEEQAA